MRHRSSEQAVQYCDKKNAVLFWLPVDQTHFDLRLPLNLEHCPDRVCRLTNLGLALRIPLIFL